MLKTTFVKTNSVKLSNVNFRVGQIYEVAITNAKP